MHVRSRVASCGTDVLIFVEDPGAANCVAELPAALAAKGLGVTLLARGYARQTLRGMGICAVEAPQSVTARELIVRVAPRLLVVGTSENRDSLGLRLVAEARASGIPSLGLVDVAMNMAYRFCGRSRDPMAYAPDQVLLPNEMARRACADIGFAENQTVIVGHPHYDRIRKIRRHLERWGRRALRNRLFPEAGKSRKVVVFVSEGSASILPREYVRMKGYTLGGRGQSTARTEIVLEEFLDAIRHAKPKPYLVLRLHPKDRPTDFRAYVNEFDAVSHGGLAFELVYAADLVVGLTSMLMMESALLGTATLSILPREEEKEWLPTIALGMTACTTTRRGIRRALSMRLARRTKVRDRLSSGALDRTVAVIRSALKDRGHKVPMGSQASK